MVLLKLRGLLYKHTTRKYESLDKELVQGCTLSVKSWSTTLTFTDDIMEWIGLTINDDSQVIVFGQYSLLVDSFGCSEFSAVKVTFSDAENLFCAVPCRLNLPFVLEL